MIGVDYVAKSLPDGSTIAMVNSSLAVNPSLRKSMPYRTPQDIAAITQIANLQLALVARLLKRETGIDMLHSPFKGSAPAHTELMGGRIDLVADPFLSVIPFVKAGKMKMLATMGERKVPGYDYPTVARRCPASASTPCSASSPPQRRRRRCCRRSRPAPRALNTPEMKKRIEDLGMEVVASRPEQFDAFIAAEMRRWARVVKEAKIESE